MDISFGDYRLRNFIEEDAVSVSTYANNRKIWLNLRDGFAHPYTLKDAETFIATVRSKEPETVFAVCFNNEAIGAIGFDIKTDVHRFTAEMGYWLAEPFWNRGIITNAVQFAADYAFQRFKLVRIYSEPFATNPASARILEKCGFEYEGRLKANVFKDGRVIDQLLYAKTLKYED